MSFCTSCGHALGEVAHFCPSCGAAVASAAGASDGPPTPAGPPPAAGPPPGPAGPSPDAPDQPPGGGPAPTTVQPAATTAPPPGEGPPNRTWAIVGVAVAVLALAGALGWWLGSDDEAAQDTTTTTSTSTTTTTTSTTTSTTTTTTTTTTAAAPARSWDLGIEWVEDGRAPAPGVEELGGAFVVELGFGAQLVRDDQGYWIWLVEEVGRQEPHAVFRLVDYEPIDLTETDATVLGATPCTVGGTPTPGVVGVFTYEDAPQLTRARAVWVISPAARALVAPSGTVVCENEGWGV